MTAREILKEVGYTNEVLAGMTEQEIEHEAIEMPYNI